MHCNDETKEIKYNILGDIKILLGRDCEMEKVLIFLYHIEIFEEVET